MRRPSWPESPNCWIACANQWPRNRHPEPADYDAAGLEGGLCGKGTWRDVAQNATWIFGRRWCTNSVYLSALRAGSLIIRHNGLPKSSPWDG